MNTGEFLAQFQAVFDQVPCGIVVASTSAEGEILLVNTEFTTITGYTLDDVPTVDHWLHKAYPDPAYREYVVANWGRDVSEPGRDVFYLVRCADGADRELLLRAGLLESGRMIVTMLDFSQLRLMQAELLKSEQRFQLIAETIEQVFWIYRVQPGAVEYVSPAFEDIWGQPASVLYDDPKRWSASILPADRARVRARWAEALAGERSGVDLEYRVQRPDGEVRWIEDRGVAVRDESDRVVRLVGIAKDVSDRKRALAAEDEAVSSGQSAQAGEGPGASAGEGHREWSRGGPGWGLDRLAGAVHAGRTMASKLFRQFWWWRDS